MNPNNVSGVAVQQAEESLSSELDYIHAFVYLKVDLVLRQGSTVGLLKLQPDLQSNDEFSFGSGLAGSVTEFSHFRNPVVGTAD